MRGGYPVQFPWQVVRPPQRTVSLRLRSVITERSWTGQPDEQVTGSGCWRRRRPWTGSTPKAAVPGDGGIGMAASTPDGHASRARTESTVQGQRERRLRAFVHLHSALVRGTHGSGTLCDFPTIQSWSVVTSRPGRRPRASDRGRPEGPGAGDRVSTITVATGSHYFHCRRREPGWAPPYRRAT